MVHERGEGPATERAAAAPPPQFEVVAGHPSTEEIAALAVALAARLAGPGQPAAPCPVQVSWADRARMLRLPPRPGPGAWRRSALPR